MKAERIHAWSGQGRFRDLVSEGRGKMPCSEIGVRHSSKEPGSARFGCKIKLNIKDTSQKLNRRVSGSVRF